MVEGQTLTGLKTRLEASLAPRVPVSEFQRGWKEGRLHENVAATEIELRRREDSLNPIGKLPEDLAELNRLKGIGISGALTDSYRTRSSARGLDIHERLGDEVSPYLSGAGPCTQGPGLNFSTTMLDQRAEPKLAEFLKLFEYCHASTFICQGRSPRQGVPANRTWGILPDHALPTAVQNYLTDGNEKMSLFPMHPNTWRPKIISKDKATEMINLLAEETNSAKASLALLRANLLTADFESQPVMAELAALTCQMAGLEDKNWNRMEAELEKTRLSPRETYNAIVNLHRIRKHLAQLSAN
ncbi:MAG: hypothetical protein OXU45_03055 [Candidatus Melainabacteria bacterium]|nr:hypothetical protein [Candidatus Melainabacteria bacterium]